MQLPTEGEELRKLLDVYDVDFRRLLIKYKLGRMILVSYLFFWFGYITCNVYAWFYSNYDAEYLFYIAIRILLYILEYEIEKVSSKDLRDRIGSLYHILITTFIYMMAISIPFNFFIHYYDKIYIWFWLLWKQGFFFTN